MRTIYRKLVLLGSLILLVQMAHSQQRVVSITGITPGQPLVYDQIFNAINADAANRLTNKNVVYELKRGQVYLETSTINSADYDLYIRAEAGTGTLPIIFHTLNSAGASANMITARQNFTLENIEIDAKHSNGTLGNRILNMYGKNYRCIFRGCRISNDRGGALAVQVDGVKLYYYDCVIGNMGHQISIGGNGRAIDIRNTATVDTVVIQNCTMYNMTDRVFRNMAPIINYFKMDHNTIVNIQGYHGCIQLGKTKKAIITNNIFADPLTHGDRFPARWRTEQMQPDKAFAVITHDSLSKALPAASVEMRNNNIYFDKKFVDFFNQTPPNDSIGMVRPINNAIIGFLGATLPQAYYSEELVFKNASPWMALYNFLTYWVTHPKASVFPNNFSELYPYEWDVTYSTTSKSYKAGDNGYPVGDLNAWPTLKAQWMQGVVQKSAQITTSPEFGFVVETSFPNPFNNQTEISYSVTKAQKMDVSVYNILGQKVKNLVNSFQDEGHYRVTWDGTDIMGKNSNKGLYLINLSGHNGKIAAKIFKQN